MEDYICKNCGELILSTDECPFCGSTEIEQYCEPQEIIEINSPQTEDEFKIICEQEEPKAEIKKVTKPATKKDGLANLPVRVPEEMLNGLREYCKTNKLVMRQFVMQAIEDAMHSEEKPVDYAKKTYDFLKELSNEKEETEEPTKGKLFGIFGGKRK